jgi:glycosyltransferase involved in cell wall biosynthesis
MSAFSVIVTAYNKAGALRRTLQSVEEALAYRLPRHPGAAGGEVVVVDDGSTDGTPELLRELTAGKNYYRVLRRERPSSASGARNTGAAASTGELLFFLDGDDLFLPEHVHLCCRALEDPRWCFVKTGVRLSDPVHPEWRPRIATSIVINLCVRRWCHFAAGGFPDYHLCRRDGDELRPVAEVFAGMEDHFYNEIIGGVFPGLRLERETVEYLCHPGNAYDRQYEKFCLPFGAHPETHPPEYWVRLRVAEALLAYLRGQARQALAARHSTGTV